MSVKSFLSAHASKILVKVGDRVKKGDELLVMGNTGYSFGNHVHENVVEGKWTRPWYRGDYVSGKAKPLEQETLSFVSDDMFKYNGKYVKPHVNHWFWEMRESGYHYALDIVTDNSWKGQLPTRLWNKDVEGIVTAVGYDGDFNTGAYGNYVVIAYDFPKKEEPIKVEEHKFGIDISEFQDSPLIDYGKLAKQIDFAFLRVGGTYRGSQDRYYLDAEFYNHYAGFEKHKVPMGGYWYSMASTKEAGINEAKQFLKYASGYKFEYPVVIDVEEPSCRTEGVIGFCEYMESKGFYVMVYANNDYLVNRLDAKRLKPYDVWYAYYFNQPEGSPLPFGIWQYTSKGKLDGFRYELDLNRATKDYAKIIAENKLNPIIGERKKEEVVKPVPVVPSPVKPVVPKEQVYYVKPNDTLWGIAEYANKTYGYKVTWQDLAKYNALPDPNMLQIGQEIKLVENAPNAPIMYVVKAGDTLSGIASHVNSKYGLNLTYMDIARKNSLPNPDEIFVGQELMIVHGGNGATYYTVRSGDNLWAIASKFDTTVDDLVRLNSDLIKDRNIIQPNWKLRVK